MGRLVDLDDLIDAAAVAALLGLSSRSSIPTYRSRYPDFPAPALVTGGCQLWVRSDVERWAAGPSRSPYRTDRRRPGT